MIWLLAQEVNFKAFHEKKREKTPQTIYFFLSNLLQIILFLNFLALKICFSGEKRL